MVLLSCRAGGMAPVSSCRRGVFLKNSVASAIFMPFAARAEEADKDLLGPKVLSALRLFEEGKFAESLTQWRALTALYPKEALLWSNRGTAELILGSSLAKLGVVPTGQSKDILLSALESFENAEALGESDSISLNNRGNVYLVFQNWNKAAECYDRAMRAGQKEKTSVSIPSENRALVAMELGDLIDAQKRIETLLRRDPNFLDGKALLAAVKFKNGDTNGAEQSFAQLCRPAVSSPNQFQNTPGIGGTDFCELYSNPNFVLDRWTPTAVQAFSDFLKSRDKNARIIADTNPFN